MAMRVVQVQELRSTVAMMCRKMAILSWRAAHPTIGEHRKTIPYDKECPVRTIRVPPASDCQRARNLIRNVPHGALPTQRVHLHPP